MIRSVLDPARGSRQAVAKAAAALALSFACAVAQASSPASTASRTTKTTATKTSVTAKTATTTASAKSGAKVTARRSGFAHAYGRKLRAATPTLNLKDLRKKQGKPQETPCDKDDFDFAMKISPATGATETEESGIEIHYKKAQGRGLASLQETGESREITRGRCIQWANRFWHVIRRALSQNKFDKERREVVCRNIASIEYRMGAKQERARVCMGDSRRDTVSFALGRVYEGSEFLVTR